MEVPIPSDTVPEPLPPALASTKASVAILVVLSPVVCVVAVVPFGSAGVPERFAAVVAEMVPVPVASNDPPVPMCSATAFVPVVIAEKDGVLVGAPKSCNDQEFEVFKNPATCPLVGGDATEKNAVNLSDPLSQQCQFRFVLSYPHSPCAALASTSETPLGKMTPTVPPPVPCRVIASIQVATLPTFVMGPRLTCE